MIGTLVGNYRIVEKLGDGGMGAVYRAVDELLDREVAVKVLRSELAGKASLIERFRAEAIALARLNHPRIATLHGLERNGADFVMIMEYVRGETLEQVVTRSGKLSWVRAVEICIDICDALDHAHDRGVVHRDIKPANVMLSNTGLIKVMDFGIARVVGRDRQTQFGHSVGTPMYMAPEQLRAEDVDGRADIYALGAVLFELITGRMAFEADSDYSLMMKQLHEAPAKPSSIVREVPDAVDQIVLKAMAKSRDDRLASAAVMRAALRDALRAGARQDLPQQPRPVAKDIAPPATRIAVDVPSPAADAVPVAASVPAPSQAVPETRFAPASSPGVPETRFGDDAPRKDAIPATRVAFDSASSSSSANGGNRWIDRELSRWRTDRVRWIGAALVVVAAGASTAKFLSAKPGGDKPQGGVVAVATDTSHKTTVAGGGVGELPHEEVKLPKIGALQDAGGKTAPTPPTGGAAEKPVVVAQKPKVHGGPADTPSTPPVTPKQAPTESVAPTPKPTPAPPKAPDPATVASRFHAAGSKQIDAFIQLIRERDVDNVERLLKASNTNAAVHQQFVSVLRGGRVEVSNIEITNLARNDEGGAAQFDATLNFRSPFGANRKSPAQFALVLGSEADGWVVKSARIVGTPKFK